MAKIPQPRMRLDWVSLPGERFRISVLNGGPDVVLIDRETASHLVFAKIALAMAEAEHRTRQGGKS